MIIRKDTHAPFRWPRLVTSSELAYTATFMPSCRYDIGVEQADINKLFGVGYFPHHHRDSVRFGWRYDIASGMVEIMAYWYLNRVRQWQSLKFAAIGQRNTLVLRRLGYCHELWVGPDRHIIDVPSRPVGYWLGPYFGGNMTAPHDIELKLDLL